LDDIGINILSDQWELGSNQSRGVSGQTLGRPTDNLFGLAVILFLLFTSIIVN